MGRRSKRPVLHIPRSQMEAVLEIATAIGILFWAFVLMQSWSSLPDSIPSHFGPSGKPDAWSNKGTMLVLPIMGIISYIGLTVLTRYPHIYSYPWRITEQNAKRQYQLGRSLLRCIKMEVVWVFAFIDWKTIQVALDRAEGLGPRFLPTVTIIVFGTLSFYFLQSYRAR